MFLSLLTFALGVPLYCIGTTEGCKGFNEVAGDIDKYEGTDPINFVGDEQSRSFTITPKASTKGLLTMQKHSGTIEIATPDYFVFVKDNVDLALKLHGTAEYQKKIAGLNLIELAQALYVAAGETEPGITSIEVEIPKYDDLKEVYVFVCKKGFKIPSITLKDKKSEQKTKTITIEGEIKMEIDIAYVEIKSGLSTGAIAGIAVACVVIVAGAIVGIVFLVRRKKSRIIA